MTGKADRVVGTGYKRALRDRVAAYVLTSRSCQRTCQHRRCRVAELEPGCQIRQRRIRSTVGLGLVIRRDAQRRRVDRKVCRVVSDIVVAQHTRGTQHRADRVRTTRNRLTRRAAVARCHAIGDQEPNQRACERWIGSAVSLARRIRRHRSGLLVDREVRSVVRDVVIAQHSPRSQRRTDRVRTAGYRLTHRATVGRCHTIGCQESCERSCQRGIGSTIDLARRIRRHRGSLRIDRKAGSVVGDTVIAQHCGWTQRGADCVRTTKNCLTGRATVGRRYAVRCQEPTERSCERGIGSTIDLARNIRRHRSCLRINRVQYQR